MEILHEEVADLINTYHELNGQDVEELHEEPSALEFMRYVARNRPFVLRRGAAQWPALQKWNLDYLRRTMEAMTVCVAMTPDGNADSVLELDDGSTMFVKPYEEDMTFEKVSSYIADQEAKDLDGVVCYCQTQNDNLRNEYAPLFDDVPKSVPFARIALQREPDAINFWLGNSRSVTALHKDPYENIYVQILGQKHFVLMPPVESVCVNEQQHSAGTFCKVGIDTSGNMEEIMLQPIADAPGSQIPFATFDPERPDRNTTVFSSLSRPQKVSLQIGDILYLPAQWYHKVSQNCSDEGICCAVNYWYDMDYSGSLYPLTTFARKVGSLVTPKDI